MYVNFLSTYSDKKSSHTSITLQTSIALFVSDSWASCDTGDNNVKDVYWVCRTTTVPDCQCAVGLRRNVKIARKEDRVECRPLWARFLLVIYNKTHLLRTTVTSRTLSWYLTVFPRDAMHKRGLCRSAVSVWRLLRSCIVSKRLKITAIVAMECE